MICCFCFILAAALNCTKHIYKPIVMQPIKSYSKQLEFANGSGSDLFLMLNAYNTWKTLTSQHVFGNVRTKAGKDAERKWANENNLEVAGLHECDAYVQELRHRVRRSGLVEFNTSDWTENEKYIVLKVVISGAFYPNYFARSTKSRRENIANMYKTLCGRDPCDTVYFTGFRSEDLPHIYLQKIRDIFASKDDRKDCVVADKDLHAVKAAHEFGTEKIFVTFKKSGKEDDVKKYGVACQPGFVLTEVYKSMNLYKKQEIPIFM